MTLIDNDGDGIADAGESKLTLRSPGLEAKDVVWRLAKDNGPGPCVGQTGTHTVDLMTDALNAPTVSWMDPVNALGYYVTDVDAKTPLGPGPVTGGTTYWALATQAFPGGFAGPISYGMVPAGSTDESVASGAPLGGAMIPAASCIKVTIVFNDFSTTVLKYATP